MTIFLTTLSVLITLVLLWIVGPVILALLGAVLKLGFIALLALAVCAFVGICILC